LSLSYLICICEGLVAGRGVVKSGLCIDSFLYRGKKMRINAFREVSENGKRAKYPQKRNTKPLSTAPHYSLQILGMPEVPVV